MAAGKAKYSYLDYAATAPLCEEAASAMAPYLVAGPENTQASANANSLHTPGRSAFAALEKARRDISHAIGARKPDELIFTSGATEADNLALFGLAQGAVEQRVKNGNAPCEPRIITTEIEHDAVLNPAKRLAREGFDVVFLRPTRQGFITKEALESALTPDTVLVSIQTANAEIGSIQAIRELAALAHDAGALFHTDATQALGKIPFDVVDLGVDAASFSSHKVYGPKGIGALYVKARTPISAQMLGGGQESNRRSGTQNVPGAVGFAAAVCAACASLDEEDFRLSILRDHLYARACEIKGVSATTEIGREGESFMPGIVHLLVDGFESETLILRLDAQGFAVSGGSACASHSLEPSHVLLSMGVSRNAALGALRISFGRYTTKEELDAFVEALDACIHSA
ncbi:MAG: cysteine desulfurase family protein [Eggerthellaceae bacterium]|nr:cysteine desulfurase family protein [Eggerthellaceae bacterium]